MRIFRNPFYLYIFSFSIVIILYQFGWSELFPSLSFSLILFFLITFIASFFFGLIIDRYKPIDYVQPDETVNAGKTIIAIYVLYFVEFLYNKGIPLILIITTTTYDYRDFGIKTLHPILETFASFYSVYIFYIYLSTKQYKYLFYLISLLIIPIILYHRGMLIINLTCIFFVYIISINKITTKVVALMSILIIVMLYLFGIAGNFRSAKSASNKYFLEISCASEKFKNSIIPKEYMWGYMYITSPLANLQNTININPQNTLHFKEFILTELCPDFLSKRITPVYIKEQINADLISPNFMVGTVYARSYSLMAWLGVYLMFIFNSGFIFIYLFLLRKSNKFYVIGISILCTSVVYGTFTNMFYFSGLSFQLIYPFLISGFLFILSLKNRRLALKR